MHYEERPERPPAYSTDIRAAWEVVRRICEVVPEGSGNPSYIFADTLLGLYPERGQYFEDIADAMAFAAFLRDPAAPLAICRAALRVVGA